MAQLLRMLLRHHESDSGRLGGGREGSSSMKQAKGMLLPVWGCFQGKCAAHRCPGPHPMTQGTHAPAHAGCWKDAPGFSWGSTSEEFRQVFLPIGAVPQPIVEKQPSWY